MNYKNILAGLAVLAAPLVSAENVQLSLEQCLAIALSDNPTIKVADMEIERLDYSKKEVIGQLLPTIDFGANYNRTRKTDHVHEHGWIRRHGRRQRRCR